MVKKRIVVCCDGTWQSSATDKANVPSNVSRLCRLLAREGKDENGQTVPQIVYYDAGIGTGNLTFINQALQGGTGSGIDTNIIEVYNFIALNYQDGDEIFCFGFSRGAYTARSVAGFITGFGICDPEDLTHLHEAWAVYKGNTTGEGLQGSEGFKKWMSDTANKHAKEFLSRAEGGKENSKNVKVIGVWDTVGALGVPDVSLVSSFPSTFLTKDEKKFGFHNVRLSTHIENAFQALALDEHRKPFGPTLFHRATDNTTTTLRQVWFPGVHINCGGGSDDHLTSGKGDFEEMANITLAWMLEQITPFLALRTNLLQEELKTQDSLRANFRDKGWIWTSKAKDQSRGYGTGPFVDSYDALMYKLSGSEDRTPGEYEENKGNLKKKDADKKTVTNEEIHPVTAFRHLHAKEIDYEPRALGQWQRRKCTSGSGYEWYHTKKQDLVLPEYQIPQDTGKINLERVVISNDAKEFFKEVDKVNTPLRPKVK